MTAIGNMLFLTRNYADGATVTPDASPPAINPVSNLKTEPPRDTWRSPNLTDVGLKLFIGTNIKLVNAICMIGHNATVNATWSLYGHASDIFPSSKANATFKLLGQEMYPSIFGAGEYFAGFGGAGGVLDDDDLSLYSQMTLKTFEPNELQYWYLEISDPTNPDGYIEMGRLFLGMYFQPTINFNWGHELELVDPSVQIRTKGGGMLTDIQTSYRRKRVTLPFVEDAEKYWDVFYLLKNIGRRGNLVVSFFPDEADTGKFYETIYGKLTEFTPIIGTGFDMNEFSFTIEELI